MKAARFHGRNDIRIDDVPEPEVRPGTVKIQVAWCGICGTDLHEYLEGPIFVPAPGHPHPLSGEEAPVTMGHEFSGTIVDVGEGVQALSVGDNVVVEPYFVCDECPPCKAGNYHLCTKMGFIGLSGGGGGLGGMVVVDTRWVHKVGNIPLDQAALIEPLSVAHHAVARSGAKPGDVALVGGSGPIGLLTAAVLKSQGVTTVISELSAARKDKAISSGVADYVIDPGQEDLQARLLELTDGVGADVAFECAGVNAVLDTLLTAVKPAGVVVNVSIWGRPATVDMQKIVLKEIDLRGTIAYVRDHAEAIKLVQEGKVNLEPFITARIALEDLVEQGFNTLIHHNDTAVKILVHP
ncbi:MULTISPECIES: 2,3-butanediol dehydrogenase [Paenarthrobacter]|nr:MULTISPECIES: 2,3-butanediol dehydrogenase [Paenarthrobacter]SKB39990.1 (R,R)-butanediol dehydrogenase / meso-butanediol dehydrogenase / diacetyl reductase [Arthrobacter sp. 31Cvi3.1E]MBP2395536.1 (R,R)-butanediol dehydrogenase/meso-butanediol dehydrogenase/diacetyl reductase [Paenarthrobacter nicotinovorans]MDI2021551.1 Sorbitol dehydrogenase [Paenarthrobacter nicotinovorans]UKE98341.1 2,3-butanediol dehydrogenase [Paenarthrobacter nicotinovorans]UKF03129.1 2,3-butanediol dehydrogenase [Pa